MTKKVGDNAEPAGLTNSTDSELQVQTDFFITTAIHSPSNQNAPFACFLRNIHGFLDTTFHLVFIVDHGQQPNTTTGK